MDIEKVNEFNFSNEEVEEFTTRWIQILVNVRNPNYLKQKFQRHKQIKCSVFHSNMVMFCECEYS